MATTQHHKDRNAIDYLLYGMAGTVVCALLFSVVLWLIS